MVKKKKKATVAHVTLLTTLLRKMVCVLVCQLQFCIYLKPSTVICSYDINDIICSEAEKRKSSVNFVPRASTNYFYTEESSMTHVNDEGDQLTLLYSFNK